MPVNYSAISIAFGIVQCLAVILTFFRLGFRLKIQRFWWEDMWAAVASLCTVVSIVTKFGVSGTNNYETILVAGRINAYMFTSVEWSVRMSLIFSIIRITYSTLLRRIALAVAAFFFLFWATTSSLETWWCVNNTRTLPGTARPDCVLPRFIIIYEVMINCAADMAGVMFPLKLLWRVKLPGRQRRMVLFLFTASRFLCTFSLAHSVAQLVGTRSIQTLLANLQLGAFLIICNLLVVVTYIYRVFLASPNEEFPSGSDSLDDDDFTTPASRSGSTGTRNLTTVDLELPYPSVSKTASELDSGFFPSSAACSTKSSESEW